MLNIDTRLLDEVKQGKITPDEFFILLCISKRINRNNNCFPSMELLKEETTFGYNKVFDCLKSLNDKGYITKQRRRINGKLTSNLYVLHTKYIGVYISVDNQEFLPPQNQAVENQAVENQSISINQSSLSINSNFEIINNFFETQDLKQLIQLKLLPYENQAWWQDQANITIEELKQRMVEYYTKNPKGKKVPIKDIKARFYVFLKSFNRSHFYKYLDQKTIVKESPIEREYSKKLEETYRNDRGEELASERIERENREYQEKLKAMTPEEKEKVLKEKQDAKDQLFAMMSKLKNKPIY
jgi:hypothetical protein